MTLNKCDMDCFNCPYDDCISDSTKNPIKVEKNSGEKKHEYYLQHREERIEYAKKRYYAKREEILKKKKEKYHEIHSEQSNNS